MKRLFALFVVLAPASVLAAPTFTGDSLRRSDNGSGLFEWEAAESAREHEVVMRYPHGHERSIYRGSIPSAHISGLEEGTYEVRVRSRDAQGWSEWSDPVTMKVAYHAMELVWTLLGLGGAVFVATAGFLLAQLRRRAA